tara:strand:+ start:118 stop:627 length:510 start_codon:yes stop_codon:yes gene_type:complete
MIIGCTNCNKKFEINSDLIPNEGRLLQCSACGHEWFYKDLIPINIIKEDKFKDSIIKKNTKFQSNDEQKSENDFDDPTLLIKDETKSNKILKPVKFKNFTKKNINKEKYKKKNNILNLTIIFIISFTAFIILIDTFKFPISKTIPNIEFILYNLYESINDIKFFLKDLI